MYPGSSGASGTRHGLFVRARTRINGSGTWQAFGTTSVQSFRHLLRKSIDEVEKQQTRQRMEANGTVEVDMRVNTAKVHVEQQETLLRQTSSSPWFLFNQDVLALRDAMGNKVYSDYRDARARVVAWRDMPVRLRALLGDIGPAKWLQHPFSGYSEHFFLRAFELGKMQETPSYSLIEFTKEKKYTRTNRFGEAVLGYQSVFGDPARCLDYVSYLIDREFNLQAELQFEEPDSNDPRARPPKPDDEDYAEKMTAHRWFKKLDEAWRECGLVQKDFGSVASAVSQLLGPDLFSYLSAHQDDLTLRSKYLYRFNDGQVAYDCSLGEKFVGPMIPLVIKKIITTWDAMPASERVSSQSSRRKPGRTSLPTGRSKRPMKRTWRICLRDGTKTSSLRSSLTRSLVQRLKIWSKRVFLTR